MAMHTLPKKLPGDWKAAFKLPSRDGVYERFIVLHPSNSDYDKFVVHTAAFFDEGENKGEWSYSCGTYCRTLERAQVVWLKAVASYVEGVELAVGACGAQS